MSYNMQELSFTRTTAGKITVLTSIIGIVVFAAVFLLNLGTQELQRVEAQSLATTTLTVLNTPPQWTIDAQEQFESSTSTPTNSGTQVSWVATATDPSNQPYFLLLCDTAAAPTATSATSTLGTNPPRCNTGSTRWAVSTSTVSGTQARAATTTLESFAEQNTWYAWICDDDFILPRCNSLSKQGTGTSSSPFFVNHRPIISSFTNNSPTLPGAVVTFSSSSSDPDIVTTADQLRLFVCSTNSFSTTTQSCTASTLATSSLQASNPSGNYTIPIPFIDQNYNAYGFIVDEHGHAANPQGGLSAFTVANATSTINPGDIVLNGTSTMILTVAAGQTTGFTLDFTVNDNNSCINSASTSEIINYQASVFRTTIGSSTCTPGASFNPNNCYPSGVGTSTWNLSCTASTTSCTGATDTTRVYNCTFPLWYVADPTDGTATTSLHFATDWSAAVSAVDDDNATSSFTMGSIGKELQSFLAFTLDTLAIPYGQLEPGNFTPTLTASTSFRATGNIGLDQRLSGEAMCNTYTSAVKCPNSATSTISEREQVFATSTVGYGVASTSGNVLSSTTPAFLDLNVPKSTSTSVQASARTFWGINVPISITFSGSYTGENTFIGVASNPLQW
jgi:hypothetical protein